MGVEIERKWLLRGLPQREADAKYWVEQFYVCLKPEIRLRRERPNGDYENKCPFVMTLKGDGLLSRIEIETPVTEKFYEEVKDFMNLEPIQKHWLSYKVNGYEVGISVLLNKDGFIYAEVEFPSKEEAVTFEFPWPELVIEEVTMDSNYKMKNYWQKLNKDNF